MRWIELFRHGTDIRATQRYFDFYLTRGANFLQRLNEIIPIGEISENAGEHWVLRVEPFLLIHGGVFHLVLARSL